MMGRIAMITEVRKIVYGCKTEKEIINALKEAGLQYQDFSKDFGYFNIRVPLNEGYFRIYKETKTKQIKTQIWEKTVFRYSGIPTFEPSGRHSF